MDDSLAREVAAIARDHRSGASALLRRALAVLRRAAATGPASLERLSPLVCLAQPSMGAIWNAVCAALDAADPVSVLDRFERQTDRGEQAATRVAATLLCEGDGALRLATCSASGTVTSVFEAVGARRPLRVACAEGRPVNEGRGMATRLAAAGLAVDMYTDAGLGTALSSNDALLLGADAVSGDWFINKAGSAQLAALAVELHVPVYVVASREKFVPPRIAALLQLRQGPAAEVWDQPPRGVTVRNPYFERVPLTLVRAVLSDRVLDAGQVRKSCLEADRPSAIGRLTSLLA
jgi:translation initiation factor 2B subunit (eIF-2B alpha/beta/delta family)